MADDFNVFISWSGERGKWVASALHDWLPVVIQNAKPWMSAVNIDPGSRALAEVAGHLHGIKVGIVCLTPESLRAPWILYESGALSKTIDDKTRLCTYLLGGLQPSDVEYPLGMFQATYPHQDGTRRIAHTINKAVNEHPIPDKNIDRMFDKMWVELAQKLETMPESDAVAVERRSVDAVVAEILENSRATANNIKLLEGQISTISTVIGDYASLSARTSNPFSKLGWSLSPSGGTVPFVLTEPSNPGSLKNLIVTAGISAAEDGKAPKK